MGKGYVCFLKSEVLFYLNHSKTLRNGLTRNDLQRNSQKSMTTFQLQKMNKVQNFICSKYARICNFIWLCIHLGGKNAEK